VWLLSNEFDDETEGFENEEIDDAMEDSETQPTTPANLFADVGALEGMRVKMVFADGHQVIAHLLSATTDIEGGQHLLYDKVEWASQPNPYGEDLTETFHAEGETLVSIDWQKVADA
jgi:hypothetical protein